VSSSVKVTDKGWMSIKAIADAGTYEVTVSAPVFYAGYVEYGTHNPDGGWRMRPRPFMHWTMDAAGNYIEPVAKIIKTVRLARDESGAKGMVASLVGELKGLAVKMVDDCRAQIIGDWIIDTGKMMRSISYSISVAGKPWMGGYLGMQKEQYKSLKSGGNTGKILKGIKARKAPRTRPA
jgi:hypothetical protein